MSQELITLGHCQSLEQALCSQFTKMTRQLVKSWFICHVFTVSQLSHFGVHSDSPLGSQVIPIHPLIVTINHKPPGLADSYSSS